MGYVLMQPISNKNRIVRLNSRTLNPAQQNYSTTEREALALVWAFEDCKHIIQGTSFVVRTDHQALTYLDSRTPKNDKVARWANKLSVYDFVIQFIPGADNAVADFLSRPKGEEPQKTSADDTLAGTFVDFDQWKIYVPSGVTPGNPPSNILNATDLTTPEDLTVLTKIASAQFEDPVVSKYLDAIGYNVEIVKDDQCEESIWLNHRRNRIYKCEVTGVLSVAEKIYIPTAMRREVLQSYHDQCAHAGSKRMLELTNHLTCPMKAKDINNYVNSCPCNHRKGGRGQSHKPKIRTTVRGKRIFEKILVDFIDMPNSKYAYWYCLTILDTFSRFLVVVPTRKHRAFDAVKAIRDKIFSTFPRPKVISSDRGTHFTSSMNEEFAKLHGVTWKYNCAYHPESCGALEVQHRVLKDSLFVAVHSQNIDWADALPEVVRILNSLPTAATQTSRFEVVFGCKPGLSQFDLVDNSEVEVTPAEYVKKNAADRKLLYERVKLIQEKTDEARRLHDEPAIEATSIEVGSKVLIYRPLCATGRRSKMR